ncbi:hypothetical protein [Persephonella sp.]
MDIEKVVLSAVRKTGCPVKIGQLEKITGIDRNSLQKAINQLSLEGKLQLDRCYNKILSVKGEEDEL